MQIKAHFAPISQQLADLTKLAYNLTQKSNLTASSHNFIQPGCRPSEIIERELKRFSTFHSEQFIHYFCYIIDFAIYYTFVTNFQLNCISFQRYEQQLQCMFQFLVSNNVFQQAYFDRFDHSVIG